MKTPRNDGFGAMHAHARAGNADAALKEEPVGVVVTPISAIILRHDTDIRAFSIDASGKHIGKPFLEHTCILAGTPRHAHCGDVEGIRILFKTG